MKRLASLLAVTALAAPACVAEDDIYDGEAIKSEDGKADSSALAVFVNFDFKGTLLTDSSFDNTKTIQDQLLYTVGHLNENNSLARVDKMVLKSATKTTVGGKTKIDYEVTLPVAWGKRNAVPNTYALKLPADISYEGQRAFAEKYSHDCVDFGAHDVDAGSMFYYYRPNTSGCNIAPADLFVADVVVSPSPIQTTGKFPEYNKVWEDGSLNVVAIFGKYEDGATTASDAGVAAYNEFVKDMKAELSTRGLVTVPATIPANPGVGTPDIEMTATLPGGKKIRVTALLSDNIQQGLSQPAFRARYENASTRADFIAYNGHAGLGANVRALASAGKWVTGQYVVVFMNGCDTFAYVDDALNTAHKVINSDDTTGYKYIDIVTNAMPSFFHSMADATMAMYRGLAAHDDPKTYEQIFRNIDSAEVVLVSGEQDNTYTPGGGGTPEAWGGINESGGVLKGATKKWETPTLAAGRYQFAMTGSGGDADLYVKIGREPTATSFDCRPYKTGSNESCEVSLAQPAKIHVQVRGYASGTSSFKLVGKKL